MPFVVDAGGVRATRDLEGGEVFTFDAQAIRKERTGVHARLSILQDGHLLAYDTFNLEAGPRSASGSPTAPTAGSATC